MLVVLGRRKMPALPTPPRESALMTFRISFEVNADTADIEREFPSVPVYSSDSQP